MKTPDYIGHTLDNFLKGYVFTYDDFYRKVTKKEAMVQ